MRSWRFLATFAEWMSRFVALGDLLPAQLLRFAHTPATTFLAQQQIRAMSSSIYGYPSGKVPHLAPQGSMIQSSQRPAR